MVGNIRDRLKFQSRAARKALAGAICAVGLGVWLGGPAALAQVTGVNPTPVGEGQTVNNVLCEQGQLCTTANYNVGCPNAIDGFFGGAPCSQVNTVPRYNYSCSRIYPEKGAVCFQWTVSPCVTYWQSHGTKSIGLVPYCDVNSASTLKQTGDYTFCIQENPGS